MTDTSRLPLVNAGDIAIPIRLAWALCSENPGIRETAQIELRKLLYK